MPPETACTQGSCHSYSSRSGQEVVNTTNIKVLTMIVGLKISQQQWIGGKEVGIMSQA